MVKITTLYYVGFATTITQFLLVLQIASAAPSLFNNLNGVQSSPQIQKKAPQIVSSQKSLSKEANIPEIPRYPGKLTFASGREYGESESAAKGLKLSYRLQKDTPEQVITWYLGALPGSGFSIVSKGSNYVQAQNVRSGDLVHITCVPINKNVTNLLVYYTYMKAKE